MRLADIPVEEFHAAMDRYAVLAIRNERPPSNEEHLAFSRRLGPLQQMKMLTMLAKSKSRPPYLELVDVGNLDENGAILPDDDRRRLYNKGNLLWHTDVSFDANRATHSLLAAHRVPPGGAPTEFADTRAAYDSLSAAMKQRISDLVVEHSVWHSRALAGFSEVTPEAVRRHAPSPGHAQNYSPGEVRRKYGAAAFRRRCPTVFRPFGPGFTGTHPAACRVSQPKGETMTLRKSIAYSAVALAFAAGGAFAQTSTERDLSISANPNVGVDANVGVSNTDVNASADISPGVNVGSGDQSVSSSTSAQQQSTDVNSSSSIDQSAATSQSSGQASGQASGSTSAQASTGETESSAAAGGTASGEASYEKDRQKHGKARGHDEDKKTGLDRADEVAGEKGQHGRDNARAKQGG